MKIQVRWPISANVAPKDVLFGYRDDETVEQERNLVWVATIHTSQATSAIGRSASLIGQVLRKALGPCECARQFVDDGEGEAILDQFNQFLYLIDCIRNDHEHFTPDDEKTVRRMSGRYIKVLPTQETSSRNSRAGISFRRRKVGKDLIQPTRA